MKRQAKAKKRVAGVKKSAGKRAGAKLTAKAKGSRSGKNWNPDLGGLYKPIKKPITLRIDADVLAWYKGDGRGYQTRINKALRKIMTGERKRK